MSTEPENSDALPLDELDIVPQWMRAPAKSYTGHTGEDRDRERRPRSRDDRDRGPRKPKPQGPPRDHGAKPPRDRRERPRPGQPPSPPRKPLPPPPPPPPSPVEVLFVPEEKGFAAMIETLKHTARAYAFFDIAKLVLNKPERHMVKLSSKSAAPLFQVTIDQSIFLRQDDAVRHVFRRYAERVCKELKTPVEPPKGNFAFVSRCGITGVWLGPPNYHEYQSRLIRHHQQKLRHISFERFKAQIEAVKDPEAVKAWVESMSFKAECQCLLDTEPKAFDSREELEKHFVENHLAQFITSAREVTISGPASRQIDNPSISAAIRAAWESERRFPLTTANAFRGRLMHEGFHFFKHGKGITYISRIKPNRFESIAHLGEQVQKIITHVRANVGCTRKQLLEQFAEADENRLLTDLHWLIQDGYIVEFFNGKLWAPADRPPKPEISARPASAAPSDPAAGEGPAAAPEPSAEAS